MTQNQPGMDQIVASRRNRISGDVVTDDLKLVQLRSRDEPGVDVGSEHASRWPDPLSQPPGNTAATGADLPAHPPVGHANNGQVPDGGRIEGGLQSREAHLGIGRPRVVEHVAPSCLAPPPPTFTPLSIAPPPPTTSPD